MLYRYQFSGQSLEAIACCAFKSVGRISVGMHAFGMQFTGGTAACTLQSASFPAPTCPSLVHPSIDCWMQRSYKSHPFEYTAPNLGHSGVQSLQLVHCNGCLFSSFNCPAKSSISGHLKKAPKPNLSSVLAWSTSTPLSTYRCRLGHSLLVALRSASTNPQVPAGFLQQTDTTNRHRITTGREGTQRHTHANSCCRATDNPWQRVHYTNI